MKMKRIYNKEDGSMGIGALIIFIALVLVAAIAAAVIIQTANKVRDDAQHTSDRISAQFLGLFNVISVYGDRDPDGNGVNSENIETLVITAKIVSSSDVDLRDIAITIKTDALVSHLMLAQNVATTDSNYQDALAKTTSDRYAVYLANRAADSPWDPSAGSYNLGPNDVVVFVINLTATHQPLSVHTQFDVNFVNTYTGAIGKLTMTTPAGYAEDRWIDVYPPE